MVLHLHLLLVWPTIPKIDLHLNAINLDSRMNCKIIIFLHAILMAICDIHKGEGGLLKVFFKRQFMAVNDAFFVFLHINVFLDRRAFYTCTLSGLSAMRVV